MRTVEISLVNVRSGGQTQELPVSRSRLLFGRKDTCQIRIPVHSVSREHCELRIEGDKAIVRDLGSSNGTYVNGQRVQEQELAPGDLLAIGPAVFVARIDGEPTEINAEEAFVRGAAPPPVAAAAGPKARPSAPRPGKPAPRPVAKPVSSDDSDIDLGSSPLGGSSVSDFDFDFLDEDDEDKKKL
jgi:predicted component of type VI protein secretion system